MFASSTQNPMDTVYYTEHGIPIRNLWHMLIYAWRELPITKYCSMADIEKSPSLDAMLASILSRLISQRLRIGLGRSYVKHKQTIRGIRGRIEFTESLKRRTFERSQAYCEFHQYSANAPKNQIVRSTLIRLIQTANLGHDHAAADELRHNLRVLARSLDGIDLIELKLDFIRRQQFGRNDLDYRMMLAICELILQRNIPSDSPGQHSMTALDRAALTLHNIYEQFIANFYSMHLKEYAVRRQSYLYWHVKNDSPYLPSMRPDLIIENLLTGEIVVLDTKFTAKSLIENQYGKQIFNPAHLYQLYAYLKTQEDLSKQHSKASGILLYPTVNCKLSEKIELEDHTMRIECIDLTTEWQAIEKQLLNLINEGKDVKCNI